MARLRASGEPGYQVPAIGEGRMSASVW